MKTINSIGLILCAVAALQGCSDSNSIAEVGGKAISQEEFQAYLQFKRIPQQDEARTDRALDEYLKRAALVAAIEESGALGENLIEAELEEFRRQMMIGRYFEEHLRNAVDDDAVRNYYTSNAEQYETQRAQVAHILLRTDSKMSEAERQAKLTTAHEAYSRIQKGEDFAEVAKAVSEDKVSAKKGGELGWLNEGAVDTRFSATVFAMEPGDVSEPFLTPFGFHIVKLIDGPQTVKQPFEAVEGDIRYQLRNQVKLQETQRLLDSVKVERKGTE